MVKGRKGEHVKVLDRARKSGYIRVRIDGNLYELTEDIGATLHHAAKKKDITMKIEGATQEITGVRQILYEMLYNLMDNGIKYNVEHGILWVRMWKTTDKIYWQVEDTGIGIAKEEQERVYERFYRVDKSHSRQTGGTRLRSASSCPDPNRYRAGPGNQNHHRISSGFNIMMIPGSKDLKSNAGLLAGRFQTI